MSSPHAALVGSTASGKSAVALEMARTDPSWEIVSVDSMQVYRGMDIGTAKPTPADRAEVPHHLIDVADPWDNYDVATYQAAARAAIDDIERRGRRAILVGGTALYLRAVVDDLSLPGRYPEVRAELEGEPDTGALYGRLLRLDPGAAARMEPGNRRRILRALEVTVGSGSRFSSFGPGLDQHPGTRFRLVGLRWRRAALDRRIDLRIDQQIETGFLAEVETLRADKHGVSRSASQALGYKELALHLDGLCALPAAVELAKRRTRRFSRRQDKWFRRDPRISWVDVDPGSGLPEVANDVRRRLQVETV